jgi:two-component sensor histidine kinase/PAS domain-containing protein
MPEAERDPKLPLFDDADETIQAIHQGDIDAVVVMRALEGPQVILLQGADEPYRVLVERMSEGALTAGPDGAILYVNGRLCELTGHPAEHFIGCDIDSLFEGEPPELVSDVSVEANLLRDGDIALPVAVWSRPISISGTTATLVTLTDLSVYRRAEQIAASERFARSVLEQATDAILVLAPDGRITHASWRAEQLAEQPPVGCTFSEAFPLEALSSEQDGVLARFSAESLDAMLATKPFHGVEVKLGGERLAAYTFLLSSGPLVDDARVPVGSIVTLTDMTERKRAEEQQTTLVAELNHRVKNLLTIVQSVAAQTIRSSGSLTNFSDAFSGRLKALGIAHDILTQTRWVGVGLSELLATVLAPYRSADEGRVTISGPSVLLPSRSVLPLSMALHELATNAAKYGALSVRGGCVDIRWRLTDATVDESVELTWAERGGPAVRRETVQSGPKVRRGKSAGFGTVLIDRVVTYDLDGAADINFDPTGVRCTLVFPVRGQAGPSKAAPGSATA